VGQPERGKLQEMLEEEQDAIQERLAGASSPADTRNLLENEIDRLLYRFDEQCTDRGAREYAQGMLQAAKSALEIVTAVSAPQPAGTPAQGRQDAKAAARGQGALSRLSTFHPAMAAAASSRGNTFHPAAVAAVVLFAAAVLLSLFGTERAAGLPRLLGLGACLCLILEIIARIAAWRQPKEKVPAGTGSAGGLMAKITGGRRSSTDGNRFSAGGGQGSGSLPDTADTAYENGALQLPAQDAWHALRRIVLVCDRNLKLWEKSAARPCGGAEDQPVQGLSAEETELYMSLLETACGLRLQEESAEEGREMLAQLRYYLRGRKIECVDYEPGKEAWFELLPGQRAATLRPALLSGGKVLRKGLASHK